MSRRRVAKKRKLLPDSRYNCSLLWKFINIIMCDGKKSIAEDIVYKALDISSAKLSMDPVDLFMTVIDKVSPKVELRSRRIGGATYQIPIDVPADRAKVLAMRSIKKESAKRRERNMESRLAMEMIDILNNSGATIKARDEKQKMADANKAFASFKW